MAEHNPSPRYVHHRDRAKNYLIAVLVIICIVLVLIVSTVKPSIEMIVLIAIIGGVIIMIVRIRKPHPTDHYYVVEKLKEIVEKKEGRPLDIRNADSQDLPGDEKAVYFPREPAVYVWDLIKGCISSKEKDIDLIEFIARREESDIARAKFKQEVQEKKVRDNLKDLGWEVEPEKND